MGKFTQWIYGIGGTRILSVKLDISQSTVQHWIARRRSPSPKQLKKILRLAKGKISERDIVRDTQ